MEELKFEEALGRLEKIVEELERGELSLEDSLKKFEEGIKLSQICSRKLSEAEKKIEVLTKSINGSFKLQPFTEEGTKGE
jgi:exodeoxyribonuclease VII small subunit